MNLREGMILKGKRKKRAKILSCDRIAKKTIEVYKKSTYLTYNLITQTH